MRATRQMALRARRRVKREKTVPPPTNTPRHRSTGRPATGRRSLAVRSSFVTAHALSPSRYDQQTRPANVSVSTLRPVGACAQIFPTVRYCLPVVALNCYFTIRTVFHRRYARTIRRANKYIIFVTGEKSDRAHISYGLVCVIYVI